MQKYFSILSKGFAKYTQCCKFSNELNTPQLLKWEMISRKGEYFKDGMFLFY